MTTEVQMLVFAAILGLIQLLTGAQLSTMQRGVKWNLSSRESSTPPLSGMAGRVDRSFKNFMETFPIFIVAVLAVVVSQKTSSLSYWGAQVYLICRVIYFFVYAAGITGVRTVVWGGSLIGLVMVLCSLL